MYFKNMPFVEYNHNGKVILTPNITMRTGITESMKENEQIYIDYVIRDGETPEMIADRIYDSPEYAFVILMTNDIHNVFEDWPVSYPEVVANAKDKYADINDVHHYQSLSGNVVGNNHPAYDRITVTNLEYEVSINDEKRRVKILHPDYVQQFARIHQKKMTV